MSEQGMIEWEINENEIKKNVSWALEKSKLLHTELEEMNQYFPYFYLTLGPQTDFLHRHTCPNCGNLISFLPKGISCIYCQTTFSPYNDSLLAFIGQIPSLIGYVEDDDLESTKVIEGSRPFLYAVCKNLKDANPGEKKNILRYLLVAPGEGCVKVYFTPTVFALYPSNWPRSCPIIMVEEAYFKVLFGSSGYNYSDFHAYGGSGDLLTLCNYANWHSVTMRIAIQQRIVPKIVIDLIVADLLSIDKLNKVVNNLGTTVHSLYNWVGKSGRSEQLKKEYDKYVKL